MNSESIEKVPLLAMNRTPVLGSHFSHRTLPKNEGMGC